MRVADLPRLGIIENPFDPSVFGEWINLAGLDLLCLGMSEEQVDQFIAPHGPASVTLLTYWADHIDAQVSRYPITVGDITRRTAFGDKQFDATLTLSVLEHVSNVDAALKEMARVTRGDMVHFFGPAWSCAYGHHLHIDPSDPNLNFVSWQMPAHMHLLCDEVEIINWYSELGYAPEVGPTVYRDFYQGEMINRVDYDRYVEAFHRYQVIRIETMFNQLPEDHLARLRASYPTVRDFSTYGGVYQLRA